MKIIIDIADDVDCGEATLLMEDLRINVLEQEKYHHMFRDIKVVPQ